MFTPGSYLKSCVEANPKNIREVIGALGGYINLDPYFNTNEFDEAVKYVLNNGISEAELYSAFDPEWKFEEDPSKWDDEYYGLARVYLSRNFCEKRIKHVKAVAEKLKQAKSQSQQNPPKKEGYKVEKESEIKKQYQRRKEEPKNNILPLLTIAAIIIVIVALIVILLKD